MNEFEIKKINKIHFVGIGGIGMSALARLFLNLGKQVSGSDENQSDITKNLEIEGVKFFNQHSKESIQNDIDVVVYTVAVPDNNSEILFAKEKNIPIYTYAEMLGIVTKNYKTIAVCGTHGKTTTTAMIANAINFGPMKASAIIGSLIKDENDKLTNFIKGNSDIFVVEACEYKKSFLNLNPSIIAITNIESDHLDFYKDLEHIQKTFLEFVNKLPNNGVLICNVNDENLKPILENFDEISDSYFINKQTKNRIKIIDYINFEKDIPELKVFGKHNILNSSIALCVARELNMDLEKSKEKIKNFSGTWRRSEFLKKDENENLIYDDYAHHPTEISTTLNAFKNKFFDKKINVIFQPHLFSRTREHFKEFIESLKIADEIILLPIYAAREKFDESISSEMLKKEIEKDGKNVLCLQNIESSKEFIKEKISNSKNEVFISMGAGDVYKIWG